VRGLLADYATVWYFAAPDPRRVLEDIAVAAGGERLQVLELPGADGER